MNRHVFCNILWAYLHQYQPEIFINDTISLKLNNAMHFKDI